MPPEVWIAGAGLIFATFTAFGGIIWKLADNKTAILEQISSNRAEHDVEMLAIRTAAFVEYKELRREMSDSINKVYLEFGEAPKAIREHVTQVELWMRDNLLPRKEYERDQDQILATLKTLQNSIDQRFTEIDKKLDSLSEKQNHARN